MRKKSAQAACSPIPRLACDTLQFQMAGIPRQTQSEQDRSLQVRSPYILGMRP